MGMKGELCWLSKLRTYRLWFAVALRCNGQLL